MVLGKVRFLPACSSDLELRLHSHQEQDQQRVSGHFIHFNLFCNFSIYHNSNSIAGLIQKGKDSARTEITLLNNGALPYEKYGDEVMIERTLSKNGSSTYRLKTHGTFHKLKRHELDFILLSLNIQLDNPVAILNQEVAKNFLRTKDPKDK